VLNLARAEYDHETKYKAFKGWLEQAARSPAYVAAHSEQSRNSLKVMDVALFEARYREARPAFEVLRGLYGSRTFAKRRFLYARRSQSYDDRLVQTTAKKMAAMAGGRDFVVAYGDGDFPLVIKGLGSSSHKKLMRLLSKKVRIVLTREYRTTKACPRCRCQTSSMKQPLGNTPQPCGRRSRVHGLSQCYECGRLWARDRAAALNIARSFVGCFRTGQTPTYLSRAG